MMGHDVKYSAVLSDDELMTVAKTEERVLLTRDLELYQRCVSKGIEAFYVEGTNEPERLAELADRFKFPLKINLAASHCPKCNAQLRSVPKETIADKVEPKTYTHYNEFWQCPDCGQIYWQGAHWDKIRATLKEAQKILEKKA